MTLIIVAMSACGGGGGGGGGGGDDGGIIGTGVVRGTAATGTAIANVAVGVKSNTGTTFSAMTDVAGKFEVGSLPSGAFLLRVERGGNQFLHGIAHGDGQSTITRNIHPFTDLIVRNWFKSKGLDVDTEFSSGSAPTQMPTEAEINAIEKEINAIIEQVLADYGVSTDIDLLATLFEANGTGFDAFLDNNHVIINNNTITVIVMDQVTNIQNIVINVDLGTDLTSASDTPPTAPTNVRALPASATEIVVVWEASSDDKGVAFYNVYRNGALIGTTPYPVYSDTGLTAGTAYRYEIEAVDGRGQKPAKTAPTPDLVLDQPDTTAPAVPTALIAAATGNTIPI